MVGKMSKLAAGALQTHASRADVDLGLLAAVTAELGGGGALRDAIAAANTARHALELWRGAGLERRAAAALCRRAAARCAAHVPAVAIAAELVGFDGEVLGRAPEGEAP
jgi:cobalt-precorrin-5B (C1)-methyltransferase